MTLALFEIGNPFEATQEVRDDFTNRVKSIIQTHADVENIEVSFVTDTMLIEILILPPFKDSVSELIKRMGSIGTRRDIAVFLCNADLANVKIVGFECKAKESVDKAWPS